MWKSRFGEIAVIERVYQAKESGKQICPFGMVARVCNRGFSLGLQRVLVDFGADGSYQQAVKKVWEHYRVEVGESAVRRETMRHGEAMQMEIEVEVRMPESGVKSLLSEMDGLFVPIVRIEVGGDGRRQRVCEYAEAKLCLAGQVGAVERRYRGTMKKAEEAGRMWKACLVESGGGKPTEVHCVGDGAKWIVAQMKKQFGEKATYSVAP